MDWLRIHRGEAPLVIAFPHGGTRLADLDEEFVSPWLALLDTDWWIADLYDFAADMGATLVATEISRSVIDMNRDPAGASLYPGQATTELCPTTTFDGTALYRFVEPDEAEITRRLSLYHRPYHEALAGELERLKAQHHHVVLYDAHSIRSHVPRLFEGELPQYNIGTNDGTTCAPELEAIISGICASSGESHIVNGRFKGGWTTRHYGRPDEGIHTIQMELAQRGYMIEPNEFTYTRWSGESALLPTLQLIIAAAIDFAKGYS